MAQKYFDLDKYKKKIDDIPYNIDTITQEKEQYLSSKIFDIKYQDDINIIDEDYFHNFIDNNKFNASLDKIQNNNLKFQEYPSMMISEDFPKFKSYSKPDSINNNGDIEEYIDYINSDDPVLKQGINIFDKYSDINLYSNINSDNENSSLEPLFNVYEEDIFNEENKIFKEFHIPKNPQIIKEGRDTSENSNINIIIHQTPIKIFQIIYPKKLTMFTKNDKVLLGKKINRSFNKRKRKDNTDNKRRKIKRSFLNETLINLLNEELKFIGSKLYFMKFPHKFVSDVTRKTNKKILYLTLKEIFENIKLYDNNELNNYYHNLNVLKNKQIQENEEMKTIINKTYIDLFTEYINSDEFKTGEINRLREKNMKESYIEDYKFVANGMIDFYRNSK
jgi:hypothetical protein